MIPISYNIRQAIFNNLVQYSIILLCVTFVIIPFEKITFTWWLIVVGIIIGAAILVTFVPYLDVYRKISTLYIDSNGNLYVDKVLVDKNQIESIQFDSHGFGSKMNQYYIMTFKELPNEIKKNNFDKNVIVFCELQTLKNWPNLNNNTQKLLKDIGVKLSVQYATKK